VPNRRTVFGSQLFSHPHPEFADVVPGHTDVQITAFFVGHDFQVEFAAAVRLEALFLSN
jgi:hypothetical protein